MDQRLHGVVVLGIHTLVLVYMHLSFVGFSLSSRNISLTTVLYLVHWLPPVLHIIYILHDCTLPVCTQKYNMYIEQHDLCTIMYIHTQHTHNYINAHMNTRASIIIMVSNY